MDQFKSIRVLGQGAQGKVYLASHRLSGLEYAVKVVDKKKAAVLFSAAKENFQEVEVLIEATRLKCRNVVKVLQVLEDHCFYIVTEYKSGGTLAKFLWTL